MNVGTFRQFMLSLLFRASTPRRTAGRERVPDTKRCSTFATCITEAQGFLRKSSSCCWLTGAFGRHECRCHVDRGTALDLEPSRTKKQNPRPSVTVTTVIAFLGAARDLLAGSGPRAMQCPGSLLHPKRALPQGAEFDIDRQAGCSPAALAIRRDSA